MFDNILIYYFDLGIWDGCQADWMVNTIFAELRITNYKVYGFEANKENYDYVVERFKDNDRFDIFHKAIANENTIGPLYYGYKGDDRRNCADSIFKDKPNVNKQKFEIVEYIRFSDWISKNVPEINSTFNILKFNIEGAEGYLMKDIVSSGLVDVFDIYCGADSDMKKIKSLSNEYVKYDNLLKENNIHIQWFAGGGGTTPDITIKNMKEVLFTKLTKKGRKR